MPLPLFHIKLFYALPLLGCLLVASTSPAQCPQSDELWSRLTYLSASPLKPEQELQEFSTYAVYNYCLADSVYALLLQRTGAAYYRKGDFIHAIDSTRKSINVLTHKRSGNPVYHKLLVKDYYILSVFYDALNMTREKMRAIDSCIDISMKANGVDENFLYTLYNRTEYLLHIGDFDRCYDYAGNGERLSAKLADPDKAEQYLISFLNIRIAVLLARKDYTEAQQLLSKAIRTFETRGRKLNTTSLYEKLAEVLVQKGEYAAARSYFQKALALYSKARDKLGYIQALNNTGLYFYFQHVRDYPRALAMFKKAIHSLSPQPGAMENTEALNILANIANVYVSTGLYDSAFHYFSLAFSRIGPGMDEQGLLDNAGQSIDEKNWTYLTALVIDKGDAYLQQYKETRQPASLQHAINTYKVALRLFERMKLEHAAAGSKLFWRKDSRRLYEHAIEACLAKKSIPDAFYFFEKSRAVLLGDELAELQQLGQNDILQQTQLKKQLLRMQEQLHETDSAIAGYGTLRQDFFAAQLNLDKLVETIKTRNPLYFQNFLDTTFITIEDVRRRLLKDHQAVVEMFAGDSAVYLLALFRNKNFIKKINKRQYDTLVDAYTAYLSDPAKLNSHTAAFYTVSHALYRLLFDGIPLPPGRVIISPDGAYFPFEALISDPARAAYLVKDFSFSYTYSARYLLNEFKAPPVKDRGNFFGMAPVQYKNEPALAELYGSEAALLQLQDYFTGPQSYAWQEATRSRFLHNYFKYKIVQLYTHAIDKGRRGEPEIFFCDSSVYLSELMPEFVPVTRLIVLSACETGKGKLYKGEGVFSFNRAFAALGIPASVTNLWQADSRATYRLTNLLYKYIAEGMPVDLALQKAKITFIKTGSRSEELPCYWAGTVLAGKTDSIPLNKPFPWVKWLLIAMIVVGVAWLIRKGARGGSESRYVF